MHTVHTHRIRPPAIRSQLSALGSRRPGTCPLPPGSCLLTKSRIPDRSSVLHPSASSAPLREPVRAPPAPDEVTKSDKPIRFRKQFADRRQVVLPAHVRTYSSPHGATQHDGTRRKLLKTHFPQPHQNATKCINASCDLSGPAGATWRNRVQRLCDWAARRLAQPSALGPLLSPLRVRPVRETLQKVTERYVFRIVFPSASASDGSSQMRPPSLASGKPCPLSYGPIGLQSDCPKVPP